MNFDRLTARKRDKMVLNGISCLPKWKYPGYNTIKQLKNQDEPIKVEISGYRNHETSRQASHTILKNRRQTEKDTNKGHYADITLKNKETGYKIVFYHHHNIVTENHELIRIDACGHHTSTTKERINAHLPTGFYLKQEDYEWMLKTPNGGHITFKSGMQINKKTGIVKYSDGKEAFVQTEVNQ